MENASKALLLTGSILVGIILLSLFMFVFSRMSEFQKSRASDITQEQILAHNEDYLSYQKGAMHGTDVITVLNKAIDNNERHRNDKSYEVNIEFTLKEDIKAYIITYTLDNRTKKYSKKTEYIKANTGGINFLAGKTYSIKNNLNEIKKLLDTRFEDTNKKEYINDTDYKLTYTGFSDFKRMIFKCTDLNYNDIGLINYMKFEQVESSQNSY